MERGTKIIIGVVAIILFLCCVAGLGFTLLGTRLMGRAIITSPEHIARVSSEIADYDTPTDFEQVFASDVSGIKLVALGPKEDNSEFTVIMMMQFPTPLAANRQEVERQMRQALSQQTGLGSAALSVVEKTEVEIKGKPVELTIQEGSTQSGLQLHQATGIFDGKQGPVLLMILGETDTWDQDMVDEFLASIH